MFRVLIRSVSPRHFYLQTNIHCHGEIWKISTMFCWKKKSILSQFLLNPIYPFFVNRVDPDQLASEEANWSGSALFVIQYVNLYQKPRSSILTGWQLEMGVAICSAWQGLNRAMLGIWVITFTRVNILPRQGIWTCVPCKEIKQQIFMLQCFYWMFS